MRDRVRCPDPSDRFRLRTPGEGVVESNTLLRDLPNVDGTVLPDHGSCSDLLHVDAVLNMVKSKDVDGILSFIKKAGNGMCIINCILIALLMTCRLTRWTNDKLIISKLALPSTIPRIVFIDGSWMGVLTQLPSGSPSIHRVFTVARALQLIE